MAGEAGGVGGAGGGGAAGGGATGAPSQAVFEAALAKMQAAAETRLKQDAERTEQQEQNGAAKQAAARTSV